MSEDDPGHSVVRALQHLRAPQATPLPAEQVRLLGSRRRRRRQTVTVAGVVTAVVLVATPVAIGLSGDLRGAGPARQPTAPALPTPRPASSMPPTQHGVQWVTKVPAGFPVALGLPDSSMDGVKVVPSRAAGKITLVYCGVPAWSQATAVDWVGVQLENPEDVRSRVLVLFPDDRSARASLDAFAAVMRGCTSQIENGSEQVYRLDPTGEPRVGTEQAVSLVQQYRQDGRLTPGSEVLLLARTGNAVLMVTDYSETGASEQAGDDALARALRDVRPLLGRLCRFAAQPCVSSTS